MIQNSREANRNYDDVSCSHNKNKIKNTGPSFDKVITRFNNIKLYRDKATVIYA